MGVSDLEHFLALDHRWILCFRTRMIPHPDRYPFNTLFAYLHQGPGNFCWPAHSDGAQGPRWERTHPCISRTLPSQPATGPRSAYPPNSMTGVVCPLPYCPVLVPQSPPPPTGTRHQLAPAAIQLFHTSHLYDSLNSARGTRLPSPPVPPNVRPSTVTFVITTIPTFRHAIARQSITRHPVLLTLRLTASRVEGAVSLEPNNDFAMDTPPGAPGAIVGAAPTTAPKDLETRPRPVQPEVTPRAITMDFPATTPVKTVPRSTLDLPWHFNNTQTSTGFCAPQATHGQGVRREHHPEGPFRDEDVLLNLPLPVPPPGISLFISLPTRSLFLHCLLPVCSGRCSC